MHPLATLEIGTSKVRVLVGEYQADNQLYISGVGEVLSSGVRKSEVVDLDNALACVKEALKLAEQSSGRAIYEVHMLFSGGHIVCQINQGVVTVTNDDQIITDVKIENVMNNARAINLPMERQIVHSICQHFYVDGGTPVVNPEGMEGAKVTLDMLCLHGVRNRIRNTIRVAEEAHLDVEDAAFGGLCAGLAVLTTAQKEGGAIVIDLGAGSTDYVVYANKAIKYAGSLAVGGDHVTNDIALGLRIPSAQAERLKVEQGSARSTPAQHSKIIEISADSGFDGKKVPLSDLNTIIEYRMREIFDMVRAELDRDLIEYQISAGVILTGGGAFMREVVPLAEKQFNMAASIGQPHSVAGIKRIAEGTDFATSIGLLRYGLRNREKQQRGPTLSGMFKRIFGG